MLTKLLKKREVGISEQLSCIVFHRVVRLAKQYLEQLAALDSSDGEDSEEDDNDKVEDMLQLDAVPQHFSYYLRVSSSSSVPGQVLSIASVY